MKISILKTTPQADYELIDSGDGEKLERFGEFTLRRPDPQALWHKNLKDDEWENADAAFVRKEEENVNGGSWKFKNELPKSWEIELEGMKLNISPTPFKHTGLFPEQLPNWRWTKEIIESILKNEKSREINVINLFGYTGAATLACAKAGAKVTHVDASKSAITWARENAEASGLTEAPIRWMLDDAKDFVRKEIKRGKKYDGVIMDPPAYGRGPNGEVWKIEESFLPFLEEVKKILSDNPLFLILNGYASGYSAIAYENNLKDLVEKFGGEIESGELTLEEKGGRLLPAGIFSRWHA